MGKPGGSRPLLRLRHRWEDDLNWILNQTGGCGLYKCVWNGQVLDGCEQGSEPFGPIRCVVFVD